MCGREEERVKSLLAATRRNIRENIAKKELTTIDLYFT